jgi:PTS system mannose-specific IIB component
LSIILTRVDNRLVHGQILETWVPYKNANSIVVFNDDVFNNSLQREIIKAFVPSYIEVIIKRIDDIPSLLDYVNSIKKRCIVLLFNIHDALLAYKKGLPISKLNLGNIHCQPGRRQVTQTIYLNNEEIEELKIFEGMGIQVELKTVPQERGTKFYKAYKNF